MLLWHPKDGVVLLRQLQAAPPVLSAASALMALQLLVLGAGECHA